MLDATDIWKAEAYFLKPSVGRGARGCRVIGADELAVLAKRPDASAWIVMEVLPGMEWTVDAYLFENTQLGFVVPRERLQLSGGICAKGRTVRHEMLMMETERILRKMGAIGPVCVQWKADAAGIPKFVECNPRLSGGVMIAAMAGANPIDCLLVEANGETYTPPEWKEITVIRNFEEHLL
jgi:carbamoyl-phosphate synthase large subunit